MNSVVFAVVRLCTAVGVPRLAMLRARLAPITASPVTPMRLLPVDSVTTHLALSLVPLCRFRGRRDSGSPRGRPAQRRGADQLSRRQLAKLTGTAPSSSVPRSPRRRGAAGWAWRLARLLSPRVRIGTVGVAEGLGPELPVPILLQQHLGGQGLGAGEIGGAFAARRQQRGIADQRVEKLGPGATGFAPGDPVVVYGPWGAGKSTLLSLIGGLYRPTTGQVLLDGHSVPDVPEHWLHQQVAMVLQDTFLFSGTLADNLRYGRPDATDAEVAAAAEAALVSDFAEQLPDGLETTVGTGGVGLSGGQRQRVGIARALLVDAPVVLLDEPTTGLDVHAEELVVQALTRLVDGRTVITTTHRPAVTSLATRTVYLRHGGVLETEPSEPPSADPSATDTRLATLGALR